MGSGDKIRGFDNIIFLDEIRKKVLNHELGEEREGYHCEHMIFGQVK